MNSETPVGKFASDSLASISPRQLLIVRLGAMGDIIHTLPAVAALRSAYPETIFGWLVEKRWADLLSASVTPATAGSSRPLIDRIHIVDTKQWRKSMFVLQTWREIASSTGDFRAPRYDAAIDFQGAIRSSILARWSGAHRIFGFASPRETPARMLYTDPVTAAGVHIIEQNLSLAEVVANHPLKMPPVDFLTNFRAAQEITLRLKNKNVERFILLNPGAGWGAKQWPAERYAEVARQLATDGYSSVINFSPTEESLARAVESASRGAATALTSSIIELIALTRRAALFIGGDTGPLHLAAALHIPVVAIFGPTNPMRTGPFGPQSIVLRSSSSITDHSRHTEPEAGLLEITAQQVVAAARNLLKIGNSAR
ncbi:MAG: lipopolysaccharide heptosyltransferase I [Terriglobales bacterium]